MRQSLQQKPSWRPLVRWTTRLALAAALVVPTLAEAAPSSTRQGAEDAPGAKIESRQRTQETRAAWPTLGGRQFWIDRQYLAGWRIQQNVLTGHFRLLDPADRRHAWGNASDVAAAFAEVREAERLTPKARRLVVLLHGWGRSRAMFGDLGDALRAAGYDTVRLSYPSTQGNLAQHAADLAAFLDRLEGRPRVSFVTHSLGAMVLRRMLADHPQFDNGIALDRAVLIAPPNQGAEMARRLQGFPLFDLLGGPVGADLLPVNAATLPAPDIPFIVIAGASGTAEGWNPLLPGDDDGVVAVAETRLAGAEAFLPVPAIHTFIVNHPRSIAACLAFLGKDRRPTAGLPVSGE